MKESERRWNESNKFQETTDFIRATSHTYIAEIPEKEIGVEAMERTRKFWNVRCGIPTSWHIDIDMWKYK